MNNFWQPLPLPPDVKAALNKLGLWSPGGIHFLFAAPSPVNKTAHHMAAISGLNAVIHGWKGMEMNSSRLVPERAHSITPVHFMGTHFDFARRRALLEPPFAILPDIPNWDEWSNGYAYVVLDPPYSLTPPHRWWHKRPSLQSSGVEMAFLNQCDALFGNLDKIEIYSWPTDCSNFFDDGHEWWGSFFWTVYAPSKNWLVTILASETD